MLRGLLGFIVCGGIFAAPVPGFMSKAAASDLVKVRLDTPRAKIQISGFGLKILADGETHSLRLIPGKDKITVSARTQAGQHTQWRIEVLNSDPTDNEVLNYKSKELQVAGEMLRLGPDEVPNELLLFVDAQNRLEAVAQIELEEYLKGVIPSEMPAQWPLEALKAQAVASRSYALRVMHERRSEHYHLDASTNHQVFKLINYLGARGAARDKIVRAVEETRGVVLVDASKNPAVRDIASIYKAYYHADCGGATEEPHAVWGYGPRNGTVKDKTCAMSAGGVWQASLSLAKLDAGVRTALKVPANFIFIDVRLPKATDSGRLPDITFIYSNSGSQAQNFIMSSQRFRETFGYDFIKSTRFSVVRSGDDFQFAGRGHGHGAGMCQFGARTMAMAGAGYKQILKRYYPRAKLPSVEAPKAVATTF